MELLPKIVKRDWRKGGKADSLIQLSKSVVVDQVMFVRGRNQQYDWVFVILLFCNPIPLCYWSRWTGLDWILFRVVFVFSNSRWAWPLDRSLWSLTSDWAFSIFVTIMDCFFFKSKTNSAHNESIRAGSKKKNGENQSELGRLSRVRRWWGRQSQASSVGRGGNPRDRKSVV